MRGSESWTLLPTRYVISLESQPWVKETHICNHGLDHAKLDVLLTPRQSYDRLQHSNWLAPTRLIQSAAVQLDYTTIESIDDTRHPQLELAHGADGKCYSCIDVGPTLGSK